MAPTSRVSPQVAKRALNTFSYNVQKAPFLPPPDECECNQCLQVLARYLEDLQSVSAQNGGKFSFLRLFGNRTKYKEEEEEQLCCAIARASVYAYQQLKSSPRLVGLVGKVVQTLGLTVFLLDSERRNGVMNVFQHASSLSTKRQWKSLLGTLCTTAVKLTSIVGDWIATEILKAAFEITASSSWALREYLYIAALVEGTLTALQQHSLQVAFLEQLVCDTRTALERRSDIQSRSLGFMILAGVIRAWNPEDAFNESYRTIRNLFKQEIERATQDTIYSASITCEQDFGMIMYTVTVSCGIAACCARIDSLASTIVILAHCLDYLSAPFLLRQKLFQPLDEDSWNILCYHASSLGYAAAELLLRNPKQSMISFFHKRLFDTCQEVFNSCKSLPVSQESFGANAKMAIQSLWRMVFSFFNHTLKTVQESYSLKNSLSTLLLEEDSLIAILDAISMIGYFSPSVAERQSIITNAMETAAYISPQGEYTPDFTRRLLNYWLETFHLHQEDLASNVRNTQLVASSRISCILDSMAASIPYVNVDILKEKQSPLFSLLFSVFTLDMQSLVLRGHAIFRSGMESHKQRTIFLPFVLSYWKQTLLQYPKILSAVDVISSLDAVVRLEVFDETFWTTVNDSSEDTISTREVVFACLICLADEIIRRQKEAPQEEGRPLTIAMARSLLKCPLPSLNTVFQCWEYLLTRFESSDNNTLWSLLRQVVEGGDAVRKPHLMRWHGDLLQRREDAMGTKGRL